MRYPVILEPASEGGYSVMVPDLPGCFSHGDTYEEAVDHAREAIELHLFGLQEEGLKAPSPRTVKEIREKGNPEFEYALVQIDLARLGKGVRRVKARRIQVTMPPQLLAAIEEQRHQRGMDRSKWLQEAAWLRLKKEKRTGAFKNKKSRVAGQKVRSKKKEQSGIAPAKG